MLAKYNRLACPPQRRHGRLAPEWIQKLLALWDLRLAQPALVMALAPSRPIPPARLRSY